MRVAVTIVGVLVSILSVAMQVAGNTAKQEKMLKEAKRSPKGILELDESNYDAFLAAPRDYSVTVLYTAMDEQFGCVACKMFLPSFEEVALGWNKKKSAKKHVFAVVDASRGMNIMRKNQFTHIPVTYAFPVAHGKKIEAPSEFDVSRQGFTADGFADWMGGVLGETIKPKKPLLTKETILKMLIGLTFISIALFIVPRVSFTNAGRAVSMLICLALIFTFTSGYMWNRIRNPPFMLQKPGGKTVIFMEGFQAQTGAESSVMIAIYSSIALSMVVLNNFAPYVRSGPLQVFVVVLMVAAMLGGFSGLIEIFRIKKYVYA
ncbi:oligosaccharyl transferase subunit ost3/OST6 [Malassezia psittaci]|uniref:Oligosaccharyl transferase subunit ost3/OST6 n=1 Tax=Malassezia psittaci TaxID=1821823 RepID=A0AAF0FGD7_9BASI|nr:oligosaccharyl transferase subunit ost3/OST6 [Malassezia psittaci]